MITYNPEQIPSADLTIRESWDYAPPSPRLNFIRADTTQVVSANNRRFRTIPAFRLIPAKCSTPVSALRISNLHDGKQW